MRAVVAVTVAAVGSAMLGRSSIPVLDVSGSLHRSVYHEGDIRHVAAFGMKASSANRRLAEGRTRCRRRKQRQHLELHGATWERIDGDGQDGGWGVRVRVRADNGRKRSI